MNRLAVFLVALCVVLAGCNAISPGTTQTETDAGVAETTTSGGDGDTGGDTAPPDPDEDRLGWENGYWYNESIDVDNSDGMTDAELEAAASRAMARIEYVRDREFEDMVEFEVITRPEYRNRTTPDYDDTFRTFDNVKFEALFFVGEDEDSLAVQQANRGSSVLGFYDSRNDSMVLISDTDQPQLDGEGTLAHELVHALQDQRYNLTSGPLQVGTRDGYNARNGIVEGEANFVQQKYTSRCGEEWECIDSPEGNDPDLSGLHWGIYYMDIFPYTDGQVYVEQVYNRDGWDAVDAKLESPPASSSQVIDFREPASRSVEVNLQDTTSGGWERVQPEPQRPGQVRPDYAVLGQSAIASMFAYTIRDQYNQDYVVDPQTFVNLYQNGSVNQTDPLNYGFDAAEGWTGDRMHIYQNPSTGPNETAYVWRISWESEQDAQEFAESYRSLLTHWGGERVRDSPETWRIDEENGSPFEDAFYLEIEGDTVTIVNAPTTDDLGDVYSGYDG